MELNTHYRVLALIILTCIQLQSSFAGALFLDQFSCNGPDFPMKVTHLEWFNFEMHFGGAMPIETRSDLISTKFRSLVAMHSRTNATWYRKRTSLVFYTLSAWKIQFEKALCGFADVQQPSLCVSDFISPSCNKCMYVDRVPCSLVVKWLVKAHLWVVIHSKTDSRPSNRFYRPTEWWKDKSINHFLEMFNGIVTYKISRPSARFSKATFGARDTWIHRPY